jgi:hypothetical protein
MADNSALSKVIAEGHQKETVVRGSHHEGGG